MGKKLSVVLPSYNEEQMIEKTAKVVGDILSREQIPYELVFVNDGSKDHTWDKILKIKEEDSCIKGICFSRNFGKESAVFAGIEQADGDCIAVMDCDLQHPPEVLVKMYRLWEDGFQVIEGVKASRGKESFIHKMFAKTFYKIISDATGIDMSRASDFKLLDRQAADEFNLIEDGDKIAVAVSGGKDSLALLYALAGLKRFYPASFTICAITIDIGFGMDFTPVQKLCDELDVPYLSYANKRYCISS